MVIRPTLCFVHFNSLTLDHLDAAWYSVSRQVGQFERAVVVDNASGQWPLDVEGVLRRYPHPPLHFYPFQHRDPTRAHSWSVNMTCRDLARDADWILFARSDYILAFDAVARMVEHAQVMLDDGKKPFVSGWCWQMAYDREARNIDAVVDIEQYGWRQRGLPALLHHPYAFRFHETDQDAGVWLTRRQYLADAGWMNEQMTAWGYQQSTFQRQLRSTGVTCEAVQDYLFAHQHHYAVRDFAKAADEYQRFGGGR
jgi:hypothetical protein